MARKKGGGRAWLSDAQEIQNSDTALRSQSATLYRTRVVDDFLSEDDLESRAIVGSKGFGKTFILKLKRSALQANGDLCIPREQPLDRHPGTGRRLKYEVAKLLTQPTTWSSLWETAIMIAVFKAKREDDAERYQTILEDTASEIGVPQMTSVILDDELVRPFSIVNRMIGLERGAMEDVIGSTALVSDRFGSARKRRAAVLVDSIDEYIDQLRDSHTDDDPVLPLFADIWNNAQIGAWRALRQLQGINPTTRVFVSIRKEAFHHARRHDTLFPNLRAFHVELSYEESHIARIIENNIKSEPTTGLASPRSTDLLEKFVGPSALLITNKATGATETVSEYWIRHCTGRPRDAVVIGKHISNIGPAERNEGSVRAAINIAGASLVNDLFTEGASQVPGFDGAAIANKIQSNVITREELLRIQEKIAVQTMGECYAAFSHLYALGLIGVVRGDPAHGRPIQQFETIGKLVVSDTANLPIADQYLVHPALADFIAEKNATFHKHLDRYNIIGNGRRWEQKEDFVFCAIGDVVESTAITRHPGRAETWPRFLRAMAQTAGRDLRFYEVEKGDHVTFVDPSPQLVVEACRTLAGELLDSPYNAEIRFGGHCGFWITGSGNGVHASEVPDIAERVQQHSRAGTLCVTEDFLHAIAENSKLKATFKPNDSPYERDIGKAHEQLNFRLFRTDIVQRRV